MEDVVSGYREILIQSEFYEGKTIDFTLETADITTIKDEEYVKSQSGGGYAYRDSGKVDSVTRNRFIYWRITEDALELTEVSLDTNLGGNNLRICFPGAVLLPGVSVFETHSNVCVLIATTNSVHRLTLPHPERLHRHSFSSVSSSPEISLPSILTGASSTELREPCNFATFSQLCKSFAGWLCQDGHCLFALATVTGSILLVNLPPSSSQEQAEQFELKQSSVMQRIWSGLVPASLRGDGQSADATLKVSLHPLDKNMCVFALCRDHKLRVWSCQNQECILVKDILEDVPDDVDVQGVSAFSVREAKKLLIFFIITVARELRKLLDSYSVVIAQNHCLHQTVDSTTGRLYIGVFLSFPYHTQFCVYEAISSPTVPISLSQVSFMFAPMGNLVDFALTPSHIWSLWTSSEGETTLQYIAIEGGQTDGQDWRHAHLQPSESNSVSIPADKEPREVYLDQIFSPRKFSNYSIIKAIQIYQHSSQANPDLQFAVSLSRQELKEQVINLIDCEIQQSAPDYEMFYDDYYDLQLRCWSKFYSYVMQYHEVGCKPMGLFLDCHSGLVCLLRKETVSLLRPCDAIESLCLSTGEVDSNIWASEPFLLEDKQLMRDLSIVGNALKLVSQQLSADSLASLENDLKFKCNPVLTVKQIAVALLANVSDDDQQLVEPQPDSAFERQMESLLKVKNLLECFEVILNSMDLKEWLPDEIEREFPVEGTGFDAAHQLKCQQLFSSKLASSILLFSIRHMVESRLVLCRDLLVLLSLMERLGAEMGLDPKDLHVVKTKYIPRTVALLRIFYSLYWITEQRVTSAPANAVESNLKQLAALEITDGLQARQIHEKPQMMLLELFLSGVGGTQLRRNLALTNKVALEMAHSTWCPCWAVLLNQTIYTLAHLLWPARSSALFPEFLVSNFQCRQLQEYSRLLLEYDFHGCPGSWYFLLGKSYLVLGEHGKALECFLRASKGVGLEDSLMKKLLQEDEDDRSKLIVLYYVKVMRLFEQFESPDYVLSVARTAVSAADPSDPKLSILWSNIFKHHLELGHNDDAYSALTSNPDPSRRRDCLHRFMVALCERGQLQELCEYPYTNLHDEFVNIMESHARTVDIATHNYYDLLYAFHVFRGNFRKAASAMYEYGMRLGQELPGLAGLQKQAKCYLAAMNSLRLVERENAWIVKPLDREQPSKSGEAPDMSPKRKKGGEDIWFITNRRHSRRKVTVLEIGDMEQEYLLVLARLQLLKVDADPSQATGPSLSAEETLVLLIQAGLFDTAFTISSTFKLPKESILEGLVSRCVKQSYQSAGLIRQSSVVMGEESWEWILANDTNSIQFTKDSSVADQAWQLLKYYIDRLESRDGQTYHRCVARKLLSLGAPLPVWLVHSYKRSNAPELLQLYVDYDMLCEAAILTVEFIDAVLGNGKEYFGVKNALHFTSPSVWLPYTTLDHLLFALGEAAADTDLAKVREEVEKKIERYHEHVERVSKDITEAAWKRAQRKKKKEGLQYEPSSQSASSHDY